MENLTNQILKLSDNHRYFVLRQATYKGSTYYLGAEVTGDGEDFTNEFVFLEHINNNGVNSVKKVTNPEILEVLAKNIKFE